MRFSLAQLDKAPHGNVLFAGQRVLTDTHSCTSTLHLGALRLAGRRAAATSHMQQSVQLPSPCSKAAVRHTWLPCAGQPLFRLINSHELLRWWAAASALSSSVCWLACRVLCCVLQET
jgi:hypothetical protein